MLEFPDKGTSACCLLKKRELAVSYRMESEETFKKRKCNELLADNNLLDRAEASSFDQKRRKYSEDSTNMNHNYVDEGYHHNRMSLDLKLNLSPSLIDLNHHHDHDLSNYNKNYEKEEMKKKVIQKGSVLELKTRKSMAWVALDLDDDGFSVKGGGGEDEMVAKVCMKCHMLVVLSKASPACPNCMFMHAFT
ncbi:unnamed protein product [Thlaspi arvense]|uniref:Uncharacterized protein n=1 Tax=Thlaspi arvense TaxID=13288 RepID=A0AAU9SMI5_THLAR|nr:unnamed protein product [Thlaspi arvense]